MILIDKWSKFRHGAINKANQLRLVNKNMTIISSNCAGGFLYHWLGLEFKSPFINLFLSNEDFLEALENFDSFLDAIIVEDIQSEKPYLVGIVNSKIRINFMHYKTFDDAIHKWEQRKSRISRENLCIMLTNWRGDEQILERFERLPFQNKVVFVNKPFPEYSSAFFVKNYEDVKNGKVNTIWRTQNVLTGKRYIDQFDYVAFFNKTEATS